MQGRLQGTDGIRREVRLSTSPDLIDLEPLEVFRNKDIITEEFVELYTYCYVRYLKKKGVMDEGEPIVIGWDPRDKGGLFTGCAVRGIQKAGGVPLCLGIVPTPVVPLFLAAKGAKGGIMITASHNPPDQNGIKLFVKGAGVKPLPAEDVDITAEVFDTDYSSLHGLPEKYPDVDCRQEALNLFREFSLDPENSWQNEGEGFSDTVLIVDPANGAFSQIAAGLFGAVGFQVVEVSADIQSDVNKDCGVADLEGERFVQPGSIEQGGNFCNNQAIRAMFEHGRKYLKRLKQGDLKVCGAVFDADGDRFIRLDYNPFENRVIVSSGDEIAFHKAQYLMSKNPEVCRGSRFINTVESDLNASIAAEKLGFQPVLTGVGDKWILLEALFLSLAAAPSFIGSVDALRKESRLSALELSEELSQTPPAEERIGFAIGAEESGHVVTAGYLKRGDARKVVFIGNGFKSALNSFASTADIFADNTPSEYYKKMERPFEPGHKKTFYVYYVKKEMLSRGSTFQKELKAFAVKTISDLFGEAVSLSHVERPEESDMLYLSIHKNGLLRAGIYVRNSGTEDKTGVNLRGTEEDAGLLDQVGARLRDYLLLRMKNTAKPWGKAEKEALRTIRETGEINVEEFTLTTREVSADRLLKEMCKQNLVNLSGSTLSLTSTGLFYIDHKKELRNET